MAFTAEEINEFKEEAGDLLDAAEQALLAVDRGARLEEQYDEVFRALHSVKGAAGMVDMKALLAHMHQAENAFSQYKGASHIEKNKLENFLLAIDTARQLLQGNQASEPIVTAATESVAAAKPTAPESVANRSPSPEVSPGRIIVVDDEPAILEVEKDVLSSSGFEVLAISDPTEVEKQVTLFSPDAIVTDIVMPKMTGVQLLTQLRSRWPDLPILFASGYVDKKALMDAISMGVDSVLEKPFRPAHLVEACVNAVRRHQSVKLLDKTINLLMYQYSDLEAFLQAQGKEDVKNVIRRELDTLMKHRRLLRKFSLNNAKASTKGV